MKQILWTLVIISVFLSASVITVALVMRPEEQSASVVRPVQELPILYLVEGDTLYNPIFPYLNEMTPSELDVTVTRVDEGKDLVFYAKTDLGNMVYSIVDTETNEFMAGGQILKTDWTASPSGEGFNVTVNLDSLDSAKDYTVVFTKPHNKSKMFFYQNFYIQNGTQEAVLSTASKVRQMFLDGDAGYITYLSGIANGGTFYLADENSTQEVLLWKALDNYVTMNEPVPEIIQYDKDGDFTVRFKFTVALYQDEAFEYWDFVEDFHGRATSTGVLLTGYDRVGNRKNEPYFDTTATSWVLDEGVFNDMTQSVYSENGEYMALVYEHQLYLLNLNYNTLTKVHGFEVLDQDYILDENDQNGVHIFNVDDYGNIDYAVYGYMAHGNMQGYNGILFQHYDNRKLTSTSKYFLALPYSHRSLKYYLEESSHYDKLFNQFYLVVNETIYHLDMKTGKWEAGASLTGYSTLTKEGILYSVDSLEKENKNIHLYDMRFSPMRDNSFSYGDMYLRVLGTYDECLVVGAYNVEDTLELLSGDVFYPYRKVLLVSGGGEVEKAFQPEEGRFISTIDYDPENNVLKGIMYRLKEIFQGSPTQAKVVYEMTSSVNLEEGIKPEASQEIAMDYVTDTGSGVSRLSYQGVSLDETVLVATQAKDVPIIFYLEEPSLTSRIYEGYFGETLFAVSNRLDEILKNPVYPKATKILERSDNEVKVLYEKKDMASSKLIDVPKLSQFPELPRGCEVTALSMFLSHYSGKSVSKMTLADLITKDPTPYDISSGMISFGDMNRGFVGSQQDASQPGWGVYIKPLMDLASQYVTEDIYDLTGATFDNVLYQVGEGNPVLVITSINFEPIPESAQVYWKTPTGYMKVSTKEHSVLVVGYDNNYVYFNDPSTGTMNKKTRESFEQGWIDHGRLAMVTIP